MDWHLLSPFLLFTVLSVVGVGAILFTGHQRERFPLQAALFLTAFALRFAVSLAIYDFGLIDVVLDEDASDSWLTGAVMKADWQRWGVGLFDLPAVLSEMFDGRQNGYQYVVATLLYFWDLGDPNRLDVAVLNCFIGAATIIAMYRMAVAAFSPEVARLAAWWGVCFPSLIVWSAQTLKEPLVIFLEAVALYACVRMATSGPSVRHLALAGLMVALLTPFRFYAVYLMAGVLVGSLLLSSLRGRSLTGPIVAGAGVVLGLIVISVTQAQQEQTMQLFGLQYISAFRSNVAEGGSGVALEFNLETPLGLVGAVVFGLVHLLFAPFPWQWSGGSMRLLSTIPELLVWWWLFTVGVVGGLRHAIRERFHAIQPILLFLLGFGLLYSLMFGNVGLAYRQRAQLLPWLLMFAAAGLQRRWARRRSAPANVAPAAGVQDGRVARTAGV